MDQWTRFLNDPIVFEALQSAAVDFLARFTRTRVPILFDDERHYLPGGKISYNARRYRTAKGVPCIALRVKNYQSGEVSIFDDYKALQELWREYRQGRGFVGRPLPSLPATSPHPVQPEAKPVELWRQAYLGWTCKSPTGDSPYLERKGVLEQARNERAVRFDEKQCVFALIQGTDGRARGVQRITPDGDKRLTKGARKSRAGIWLSAAPPFLSPPAMFVICEGLATGLTLRSIFSCVVLCALDAGNLFDAAAACRELSPEASIVIASDNDCHRPDKPNIGLAAATEAAKSHGCNVLVPPVFAPDQTDWNDLALALPATEFRKLITDCLNLSLGCDSVYSDYLSFLASGFDLQSSEQP